MSDVLSPINVFGIGEVRTHTAVLAVDMDVPARDWWRRCGEGTPWGQGQNTDRGQSPRGRQAFATNHHFGPSHTEPLDDRSQISLALPVGDYIGCRSSAASRVPAWADNSKSSACGRARPAMVSYHGSAEGSSPDRRTKLPQGEDLPRIRPAAE